MDRNSATNARPADELLEFEDSNAATEPMEVSKRDRSRFPTEPGLSRPQAEPAESKGVGGFLRSLLSGIPWSEKATRDFEKTLNNPLAGRVELTNTNGRTRVVGEDRKDVLIRGQKQARAESASAAQRLIETIDLVAAETASGVLVFECEIPRSWNRHGSIDLEVRVPQDTEVSVTCSNGKVCLEGLRHGVRARSSNGSIRLEDIMGPIELITANAKICCANTVGQLVARSSNGKIDVDGHRGALNAETSNGLIRAQIIELDDSGLKLSTSNGRIILELPEQTHADLDIRVDNGVIRNELSAQVSMREKNGRLKGQLGRGGCPIKLRTSNGAISLR
ncbi:MAG: hypothetical protein CBC48_01375 [bacterium TMED88]|nr:hypothetical protein [Deltaproteobacteria bacterium]OUV36897.1 MAG: hypothetical protein CBC48_01375 [bacterium TMED88]